MFSIERSRSTRKAGLITLLGVLLVPLLVAGGFLVATYHSQDRLARVQAAVVNLDDPVRLNGQLVPLGRQLAGGLVNGSNDIHHQSTTNFTWVLSDRADAASGLADGTYAAVVTIPKSFSADATSYAKNKADDAQHATLDVQTSAVAGVTDPAVAQAISTAAVGTLNTTLTKSYLENVYLGFNDTKKQFTTVADGAGKLADGATQLAGGIDATATGTGKLADGMHQLSDGASQLAGGVSTLDSGTGKLADGLGQAATGAEKLATGTSKLDTGLSDYADGSKAYAAGAKKYAAGVRTFDSKGGELATGVGQYATGVKTAYGQLQSITAAQLKSVCARAQITEQQCAAVTQTVTAINTGVFTGDGTAKNPGLIAGAAGLSAGVTAYTDGAGQLSDGAAKLSSGASTLAGGAGRLSSGLHQVSGGISSLSTGIAKSATGTRKLADGVGKLDTGASQLAVGVSKSATGVDKLHTGTVKLAAGGDQLADGTTKLADGLAKGAKQIPTYTASDRTALASVVAAPVSSERPDSLFSDTTTTTLLALLALWLGGLVSFLVFRVVPTGALGSARSSLRLALEALAPGAAIAVVQAVVFSVVLQRLLDLSAADFGATLGFLTFAAVTFAVVNHALAAWFGGFGRFLSAVAMAVVAAAALTSAVPGPVDSVRAVLPLTPGLDGLRAVVTGASGTGHAVGILLAWFVVGAVASVVAVARKRMLPAHATLTPTLA